MIFPDLISEMEAIETAHETVLLSDILCSHCNRRIKGRVYEMDGKHYDSYCWQFRHILQISENDSRFVREQKLFDDD
ncbi:MAG: hypothetical protein ACMUIG_00080 [Thermoplasmatota archaeon]